MSDLWQTEEGSFPTDGSSEDQLRFLIRYGILAPSGHNTQLWNFKVEQTAVSVYADQTRALSVVDPDDRELTVSCRAAHDCNLLEGRLILLPLVTALLAPLIAAQLRPPSD